MDLHRRDIVKSALAFAAAAQGAGAWAQSPQPVTTIRLGVAQPAIGNPPGFYGSSISIAHAKGWIDQEFSRDNVKIEWFFFKGAPLCQSTCRLLKTEETRG